MPKALIIEDDLATRTLMKNMLENIDFDVDEAHNGIEGLENIEKCTYDVVLLDIHMPEMDGIQMMTVVKERNLDLPVIVVSGYVEKDGIEKLRKLGANHVMRKPFDLKEFYKVVENLVDRKE